MKRDSKLPSSQVPKFLSFIPRPSVILSFILIFVVLTGGTRFILSDAFLTKKIKQEITNRFPDFEVEFTKPRLSFSGNFFFPLALKFQALKIKALDSEMSLENTKWPIAIFDYINAKEVHFGIIRAESAYYIDKKPSSQLLDWKSLDLSANAMDIKELTLEKAFWNISCKIKKLKFGFPEKNHPKGFGIASCKDTQADVDLLHNSKIDFQMGEPFTLKLQESFEEGRFNLTWSKERKSWIYQMEHWPLNDFLDKLRFFSPSELDQFKTHLVWLQGEGEIQSFKSLRKFRLDMTRLNLNLAKGKIEFSPFSFSISDKKITHSPFKAYITKLNFSEFFEFKNKHHFFNLERVGTIDGVLQGEKFKYNFDLKLEDTQFFLAGKINKKLNFNRIEAQFVCENLDSWLCAGEFDQVRFENNELQGQSFFESQWSKSKLAQFSLKSDLLKTDYQSSTVLNELSGIIFESQNLSLVYSPQKKWIHFGTDLQMQNLNIKDWPEKFEGKVTYNADEKVLNMHGPKAKLKAKISLKN